MERPNFIGFWKSLLVEVQRELMSLNENFTALFLWKKIFFRPEHTQKARLI